MGKREAGGERKGSPATNRNVPGPRQGDRAANGVSTPTLERRAGARLQSKHLHSMHLPTGLRERSRSAHVVCRSTLASKKNDAVPIPIKRLDLLHDVTIEPRTRRTKAHVLINRFSRPQP